MTCIFTGCLIRLSHQQDIYSSDAHAVGEAIVFVRAQEPRTDVTTPDVVINTEDRFHFWERDNVYVVAPPALLEQSEEFKVKVDNFFEEWFQSLPVDDVVELDRYEPDYDRKCEVCGNSPTVTGIKDSTKVLDLGLCGCCTWGEASALDPSTWN